jgi:hypothetical protein
MSNHFTRQMDRINNELAKAYGGGRPMAKALGESSTPEPGMTMSGEEFMAKALKSQAAGHISASQLTECELHINACKAPPAAITRAVVNGVAYSPWG